MRKVKEAEERRNEILDAADERVGIARGMLYYQGRISYGKNEKIGNMIDPRKRCIKEKS